MLVVENYTDLRSVIVSALVRKNYDCESATTTEEAVEKLRHHHYSAILLAPTLPITSDPVMHFLHEEQPGEVSKVILMTDPEDETTDCPTIVKPFNAEQLLRSLRTVR